MDNMFVVPAFGKDGSSVVYTQQHGIPMGLSVCVIIANIFVGNIFGPVFRKAHREGIVFVHLARGYVDDGFGIVTGSPKGISTLQAGLNAAHPSISVTIVCSPTHAVFLDMSISKGARWTRSGGVLLDCKVYAKPNSLHLYIPYTSSHPRGALTGFISGEARRFVCLCTDVEDARSQCLTFAQALQARGYPLDVIVSQLSKIDYNQRMVYLKLAPAPIPSPDPSVPVPALNARTVAFVVPYTPTSAHWGIGDALRSCFEAVPHLAPVLAWRNASNLQRTLGLRCLKPPPDPLAPFNPPPK